MTNNENINNICKLLYKIENEEGRINPNISSDELLYLIIRINALYNEMLVYSKDLIKKYLY